MPTKKWVMQRSALYVATAAVVVLAMMIKGNPDFKPRFTCDELRPLLAGLSTLAAWNAWPWVSYTPSQTWRYHRWFALSFTITLTLGLFVLDYLKVLNREQTSNVLSAITLGAIIGFLRVLFWIDRDEPIEF